MSKDNPKLPPTEDSQAQAFPTPEKFNYRKPPVEFTFERRMRYLYELRRTGLLYRAAELVGVTSAAVDKHRKSDSAFDAAVREAKNQWVDETLVTEAVRRAVHGVQKPIIGGKFRDEVVATEMVYSDALMAMMLKSNRPEFREGGAGDPSKYDLGRNGVVVVPASPKTPAEWQELFGDAANPK